MISRKVEKLINAKKIIIEKDNVEPSGARDATVHDLCY